MQKGLTPALEVNMLGQSEIPAEALPERALEISV
jgi:hypothetical protein